MPVEAEDGFQKELVELFVQEAHEWLQQIHVALDELQQAPESDRHRLLAQTIKVGITNLGGSAATVHLADVERASFSALPLIEVLQDPSTRISVNDFVALCKQLGHIHGALTRATGVAFEAVPPQTTEQNLSPTVPTKELVTLLQGLQMKVSSSQSVSRNLIQTIVAQAEALIQRGMEHYQVSSIQEFLDRSAEGREQIGVTITSGQVDPGRRLGLDVLGLGQAADALRVFALEFGLRIDAAIGGLRHQRTLPSVYRGSLNLMILAGLPTATA